jgi:hypothetical protein
MYEADLHVICIFYVRFNNSITEDGGQFRNLPQAQKNFFTTLLLRSQVFISLLSEYCLQGYDIVSSCWWAG